MGKMRDTLPPIIQKLTDGCVDHLRLPFPS